MYALDQAIDEYSRRKNIHPCATSFYATPLEQLRRQIETQRLKSVYLPADRRKAWYFIRSEKATIKMEAGRLPYLNFLGSRYSSTRLRSSLSLVNKTMWVRYDPRDLRTLLLFHEDGKEFGPVVISGQWNRWPHDLRMKRLYLKAKKAGELGERPEDAPLAALFAYLRRGAVKDKDLATHLEYVSSFLLKQADSLEMDEVRACREWKETSANLNSENPVAVATSINEHIRATAQGHQRAGEFVATPSAVVRFANFPRSIR